MNGKVTFEESDWRALSGWDKRALLRFSRIGIDFAPLINVSGVAQRSMNSLLAMGLAIEGQRSIDGRTFKITEKGLRAVAWAKGSRPGTGHGG